MRLIYASLPVLPSSASLILLMNFFEVGAVELVVAKLVAVLAIGFAEVAPRRLHSGTASRDISCRIGVGAGEAASVDF